MKNKKYFCYEIVKNLSVWSLNGQIAYNPCSIYQGHFKKSNDLNIQDAWNSDGRRQLLDMIENDQPITGCDYCYQAEASGIKSRRQHSQELYEQYHSDESIHLTGPQGLDYSVGNLCNLKCVICGPNSSSQWISDYQKLNPTVDIEYLKYQKNNQLRIEGSQGLDNLISVHFHGGGDPLMSDAHVTLLKNIQSTKGLGDVRVFYNTNGTQLVSPDILELWQQCKLIELYFSVDDIGHRFEYQRTGAKFDILEKNLRWFYNNMPHNHLFKVNAVWGYLNLFYLDELVEWHRCNFSTNRYGDTVPLIFQRAIGITQLNHIDIDNKQKLLKKFSKYPELCNLVDSLTVSNQSHKNFLDWIKRLDQIRNQDFDKIAPEWSEILNECSM